MKKNDKNIIMGVRIASISMSFAMLLGSTSGTNAKASNTNSQAPVTNYYEDNSMSSDAAMSYDYMAQETYSPDSYGYGEDWNSAYSETYSDMSYIYSETYPDGYYDYLETNSQGDYPESSEVDWDFDENSETYYDPDNETIGTPFRSVWRTGYFSSNTGMYAELSNKICYYDYLYVTGGTTFYASVSDDNYMLLIRELSETDELLASYCATDGKSYTLRKGTVKVGVSLHCPTNKQITYEQYEEAFNNGLTASFSSEAPVETETATTNNNTDESQSIVFADQWKKGGYSYTAGEYDESAPGRICYSDYVGVSGGEKYVAKISNSNYHFIVRELDSNYNTLQSNELVNNQELVLNEGTCYLAITLYNPINNKLTYDDYKNLFDNGFQAMLYFVN